MTNRGEVTNSLPAFYLATPGATQSAAIRPSTGLPTGAPPYIMPNPHQPLGPAFSLQPYAAYPHGVIYQPVMVPPMFLQPQMGMMMPSSSMMQPQQTSRIRPRQNVIFNGMPLTNWIIYSFFTNLVSKRRLPYAISVGQFRCRPKPPD